MKCGRIRWLEAQILRVNVPLHEEKQIFLSIKVTQTPSDSAKYTYLNPQDNLQRSDRGWASVNVGSPAGEEESEQSRPAVQ